jgi:hypothetical protein
MTLVLLYTGICLWGMLQASTATGSWRGMNTLLLLVFKVTLFCPCLRRTMIVCKCTF